MAGESPAQPGAVEQAGCGRSRFCRSLAVAGEFRSPDPGTPAVQKISDQLRAPDHYELLFQHDDWQTA